MSKSITQLLDPHIVLSEGGLKAGETVADFGCGTVGHFIFPAATIVGNDGRVLAIDIQKSVLQAVKSRAQLMRCNNVEMLWSDIERKNGIGVADQTFDLSLIVNNLSSTKDLWALAEEARRVTKVGGRLVVVDWRVADSPMGPPLERRLTAEQAQTAFVAHGFVLDHPFIPGAFHWGLVFRRDS